MGWAKRHKGTKLQSHFQLRNEYQGRCLVREKSWHPEGRQVESIGETRNETESPWRF
jgi:hypothetical protein